MPDLDDLMAAIVSGRLPEGLSILFCSGVIDAERRRWRAPEKLRLIAAMVSSRVLRLSCGPAYRAVIACAHRCGRIPNFQSQRVRVANLTAAGPPSEAREGALLPR